MNLLEKTNIYEVLKIEAAELELSSILTEKEIKKQLSSKKLEKKVVEGDLFLISENDKAEIAVKHYPVKKIKGRYSDFKEYIYLKMRILLDFYNHNYQKAIFHAEQKPAAYKNFEAVLAENEEKLKKYITYNSDEKVKPFNHTNYPIAEILKGELIFEQEEGRAFDWQWNLMRIYRLGEAEYISFKKSSIFRERQRGEYFKITEKAVNIMRDLEEDKDDFLD